MIIWIVIFTCTSVWLRFNQLGQKPFWPDESEIFLNYAFSTGLLERIVASSGSVLGLAYAAILPEDWLNEFVWRFPAALWGVLTVLLPVWFFATRQRLVGFAMSTFLLLSPLAHYFAREGRPYAGLLFFSVAIWLCAFRAIERGRISRKEKWFLILLMAVGTLASPFVLPATIPAVGCAILMMRSGQAALLFSGFILLAIVWGVSLVIPMDVQWFQALGYQSSGFRMAVVRPLWEWICGGANGAVAAIMAGVAGVGIIRMGRLEIWLALSTLFTVFGYFCFFGWTNQFVSVRYFIGLLAPFGLLFGYGVARIVDWLLSEEKTSVTATIMLAVMILLPHWLPFASNLQRLPVKPTLPSGLFQLDSNNGLQSGVKRFLVYIRPQLPDIALTDFFYKHLLALELLGRWPPGSKFIVVERSGAVPMLLGGESITTLAGEEMIRRGHEWKSCEASKLVRCIHEAWGGDAHLQVLQLDYSAFRSPCETTDNCLAAILDPKWLSDWRNGPISVHAPFTDGFQVGNLLTAVIDVGDLRSAKFFER